MTFLAQSFHELLRSGPLHFRLSVESQLVAMIPYPSRTTYRIHTSLGITQTLGTRPPRPPNPGGRKQRFRAVSPQDWGVRGANAGLSGFMQRCVYTVACTTGFCLGLSLCCINPTLAQTNRSQPPPNTESRWRTTTATSLEQEGKTLFEAGQWQQAVTVFQHAIARYQSQGDLLGVAIASSNLARVYGQLGQWPMANQAIATSLTLLQRTDGVKPSPALVGQVLMIQGQLQLAQGRSQAALDTWQQAESRFRKGNDPAGVTRSRINQAQALQVLGFSRRAIALLTQVLETLDESTPSPSHILAFRSLGDALRGVGELEQSLEVLGQSLALAERLQLPAAVGATQLSLGNTQSALGDTEAALDRYQQAAQSSGDRLTRLQAQLNQLSLWIETEDWAAAQAIWPVLLSQLGDWGPSRQGLYAHINLARSLIQLRQGTEAPLPTVEAIERLLTRAQGQAQALADPVAESYVVGTLGSLYEQIGQHQRAETLTQQALVIAQANNAPEVLFQWQWQLGRILKARGQQQGAVSAYSGAIQTLQVLRGDLIAATPKVRFDFRDNVEPIHRQLVALLLELETQQPNPQNLEIARLTIESLQLAELDNFFRQACLDANPVLIDQIDRQAAVIYPIILPDQLAVIVSLPGQTLRFYSTPVPQSQVERTADRLRLALGQRNSPRHLPLAQQMYDWLLQSAAADLAQAEVKTLVFVLDGVLRNVPMAVLHDGDRYLVEQYGVALTPGLQLLEPRPLPTQRLNVLAVGLSESRQGFSALPFVNTELAQIEAQVPSLTLQNQKFTQPTFREAVNTRPFPVVHLATHGQFSSALDQTFLLTWEDRLTVNQLRQVLRGQ